MIIILYSTPKTKHMQTKVTVKQLTNINDQNQNYIIIENEKGKCIISIGEKNYNTLAEMLNGKPTENKKQNPQETPETKQNKKP